MTKGTGPNILNIDVKIGELYPYPVEGGTRVEGGDTCAGRGAGGRDTRGQRRGTRDHVPRHTGARGHLLQHAKLDLESRKTSVMVLASGLLRDCENFADLRFHH